MEINRPTKVIPLDQIHIPAYQMRPVDKNGEDYLQLKASIKRDGMIQPIGVREEKFTDPLTNKTYNYGLIYGFHRINAVQELGEKDIKCEVFPKETSDSDLMNLRMIENVMRKNATPSEIAKQLQRIIDVNPGVPVENLLARFGYKKTPSWCSQMLKLNKLNDESRKMVDDGRINLRNGQLLGSLPKEIQKEYQADAVELGSDKFAERISQVKANLQAADKGEKPVENPFMGSSIRKKNELQNIYLALQKGANPAELQLGEKPSKEQIDSAFRAIAWAISMDAESIAMRKADRERSAAERQKNKDNAESVQDMVAKLAQKDPAKLEEAKKALAALGVTL